MQKVYFGSDLENDPHMQNIKHEDNEYALFKTCLDGGLRDAQGLHHLVCSNPVLRK